MSSLRETRSKTRSRSASVSGDASGRGSRPSLIPRPPTSSNDAAGPSQGDRAPTQEFYPVPAALMYPLLQEGSPRDANIVASIAAHVEQNLFHRVATQVEKSLEKLHTSVNSLEERISHLEKQNSDLGPAPLCREWGDYPSYGCQLYHRERRKPAPKSWHYTGAVCTTPSARSDC